MKNPLRAIGIIAVAVGLAACQPEETDMKFENQLGYPIEILVEELTTAPLDEVELNGQTFQWTRLDADAQTTLRTPFEEDCVNKLVAGIREAQTKRPLRAGVDYRDDQPCAKEKAGWQIRKP